MATKKRDLTSALEVPAVFARTWESLPDRIKSRSINIVSERAEFNITRHFDDCKSRAEYWHVVQQLSFYDFSKCEQKALIRAVYHLRDIGLKIESCIVDVKAVAGAG